MHKKCQKIVGLAVGIAAVTVIGMTGCAKKEVREVSVIESEVTSESSGSSDQSVITYNGESYRYNDHLSNYLFLGIDRKGEAGEKKEDTPYAGQSDVIYLVSMDRVTNQMACIAIPRDTMTEIEIFGPDGSESIGTKKDHLNLQYSYGDGKHGSCEMSRNAVSRLMFGIPINGYCSLNMEGMPLLAKLIGGVTVTIPDDSLAEVNPEFTSGANVVINEDNAEQFLRYRDIEVDQSAINRMNRQMVFMKAFMNKAQTESAKNPSIVSKLYDGLQPYMVTNMGNDLFAKLLQAYGDNPGLEIVTIPGEGVETALYDEYHVDEYGLYDLVIKTFYKKVSDK